MERIKIGASSLVALSLVTISSGTIFNAQDINNLGNSNSLVTVTSNENSGQSSSNLSEEGTYTVDGSKSKILDNGSVDIVETIQGKDLDKLDLSRLKMQVGEMRYDTPAVINEAGTEVTISNIVPQYLLTGGDSQVQLVIDEGQQSEQVIGVTANASIEDVKTAGNYDTYLSVGDTSGSMTIGAIPTNIKIDSESIDGSKTKINNDGSVTVIVEVQGQNLNKLNMSKVKLELGNSLNSTVAFPNSAGTQLTVTNTLSQSALIGDLPLSLVINNGQTTEQTLAVKADESIASSKVVNGIETYISVDDVTNAVTIGTRVA